MTAGVVRFGGTDGSGIASPPAESFSAAQRAVAGLLAPRAGLLAGGQPEPHAWALLAACGVTTVVNLRTPAEMGLRDEAAEVRAEGLRYAAIPVDGAAGITRDNARALQAVIDAADGTVLVHCASGNRVGALLALAAAAGSATPDVAIAAGRAAGLTSAEPRVRAILATPAD